MIGQIYVLVSRRCHFSIRYSIKNKNQRCFVLEWCVYTKYFVFALCKTIQMKIIEKGHSIKTTHITEDIEQIN